MSDSCLVINTSRFNTNLFLATPTTVKGKNIVLIKGPPLEDNALQKLSGQQIRVPVLVLGLDSQGFVSHIPSDEFNEVTWIGGQGFGTEILINDVPQVVGNQLRPFGTPLPGYYIPPGSTLRRIDGPTCIDDEAVDAYISGLEAKVQLFSPSFYLITGDNLNLRAWEFTSPKNAVFKPSFPQQKRMDTFSKCEVLTASIRRLARMNLPKDPDHQTLRTEIQHIARKLTQIPQSEWVNWGIAEETVMFIEFGHEGLARRIENGG